MRWVDPVLGGKPNDNEITGEERGVDEEKGE